jgi:hypothetical protein
MANDSSAQQPPQSTPSSPGGGGVPPTSRARDLTTLVLVEAVGSSFTPFVPVPFVDDYLFGRLLRRITFKVVERGGGKIEKPVAKSIVEGYAKAGDTGLGEKAVTAAARFVIRKVAVVLDVKKSHDVFGESIAFALALDVAMELRAIEPHTAVHVGGAIYRATQSVGSAAIEVLTRAGREAFKASEGTSGPESGRFQRVGAAIGRQVDDLRLNLDHLMRYELSKPQSPR